MPSFQLKLLNQNKIIQISGRVYQQSQPHYRFLQERKRPPPKIYNKISKKFNYQGEQLGISFVYMLLMISAEMYNIFDNSSNILYELLIISSLLYSFIFILKNRSPVQLLIQGIIIFHTFIPLFLAFYQNICDPYALVCLIGSMLLIFAGRSSYYLQETLNQQSTNPNLEMESNLLLGNYFYWKVAQYGSGYLGMYQYNYTCLLSSIVVFAVINTIKVYYLFDYQILHVLDIFKKEFYKQASQNENKDDSKKNQQKSLLQVQNLQIKQKEGQKQMQGKSLQQLKVNGSNLINHDAILQKQKDDSDDNTSEESQSLDYELTEQQIQKWKSYQTCLRLPISLLMLLSFLIIPCLLIYYRYLGKTNQKTYLFSAYFSFALACILTHFQTIKIFTGQQGTRTKYFLQIISQFMVVLCRLALIIIDIDLQYRSKILIMVFPFISVFFFNFINSSVHLKLQNGRYWIFLIFQILPLSIRASLAVYTQLFSFSFDSYGYYFIDAIIYITAGVSFFIWIRDDSLCSILKPVVRIVLQQQQNLSQFFQILKQSVFDYDLTLKTFTYLHFVFLSIIYPLLGTISFSLKVTYIILYLSPIYFYVLGLRKSSQYSRQIPSSYRPSIINIIIFALSLSYAIVSYFGLCGQYHDAWSLILTIQIGVFGLVIEGEVVSVIYMDKYFYFVRVFVISIFYIMLYLPFVSLFVGGYFFFNFSANYMFLYAVCGFLYIWLIVTIVGVIVHWVLNLSQKSKKDLFISHYMCTQMRKINMKEDIQKILMMASAYQSLSKSTSGLIQYLNSQKYIGTLVRKQKDYEHDYQFVEPEDAKGRRRLSIRAKDMNFFKENAVGIVKKQQKQVPRQIKIKEVNPVLSFFQDKSKQVVMRNAPQVNHNKQNLQKFLRNISKIPKTQNQIKVTLMFKNFHRSNDQTIIQTMSKLYQFLSQPGQRISHSTFGLFVKILLRGKGTQKQIQQIYDKFSYKQLCTQYKFKEFILDYVQFKYEMIDAQSLPQKLRTFCCFELVPLMLGGFDVLEYSLMRKQVKIGERSKQIWSSQKAKEQQIRDLVIRQRKQQKNKQKILQNDEFSQYHKQAVQLQAHQDTQQAQLQKPTNQQKYKIRQKIIHMKQKQLMTPQVVNSILANALSQCYVFYQRQKTVFQVKQIKCSLSNILAIVTKILDMILVFGYPTIMALIAYYYQNFDQNRSYLLGSIQYYILISIAGGFTLLYVFLIRYHKNDFQQGTLGLDTNMRSLGLTSFKFYTTSFIFLLGSGLANQVMSIALNSWICEDTGLYNFTSTSAPCNSKMHYMYILVSLLILVIYWPMATLTYPFSNAVDRILEIKYKTQYETVYLQCKFLINGYNILLNPFSFKLEQFISSVLKTVILTFLAVLFIKTKPCSYSRVNDIQGKMYIGIALLNFAGALCYFVGFVYALSIVGSILAVYIAICIIASVMTCYEKSMQTPVEDDWLIQNRMANQTNMIRVMKQENKENAGEGLQKAKVKQGEIDDEGEKTGTNLIKTEKEFKKSIGKIAL